MALCHVTGTVYLPDGSVAARREVVFYKLPDNVTADYLGAVVPEPIATRTDNDGAIDVNLITGNYHGYTLDRNGANRYQFKAVVPESATADFSDLITAAAPVEPLPAWLQQAIEARDEARDEADRAEAAAVSADTEADRAEVARDDAQGVLSDRLRRDVPTLLADTALTYTSGQPGTVAAGDIVRTRAEGFSYQVAASGAADQHVTTAGGVKLYVQLNSSGHLPADAFGLVGDGVTDDSTVLAKAFLTQISMISAMIPALGGTSSEVVPWLEFSRKHYFVGTPVALSSRCFVKGNKCTFSAPAGGRIFNGPSNGYLWEIEDVVWWGDDVEAIYADMNNLNNAEFYFRRNYFANRVITEGKFAITIKSQSSRVVLEECNGRVCPNILHTDTDFTTIKGGWYSGHATAGGVNRAPSGARFRTDGRFLWVSDGAVFIPEPSGANRLPKARWFDRHGTRIYIRDCHFGAENAGFPLIYDFGPSIQNSTTYSNLSEIVIENTQVACGSASRPDAGIVVLQDGVIPGRVRISRVVLLSDAPIISDYGHDEAGTPASRNDALRADLLAADNRTRSTIDLFVDALGHRVPNCLQGYVHSGSAKRAINLTSPATDTALRVVDVLKTNPNNAGIRSHTIFYVRVTINRAVPSSRALFQESVFRVVVLSNGTNTLIGEISKVPERFYEWGRFGDDDEPGDVLISLTPRTGATTTFYGVDLTLADGGEGYKYHSAQVEVSDYLNSPNSDSGSLVASPVLVGP